jgi:Beta xylosidase C-terminal Concanavalin A-like domain
MTAQSVPCLAIRFLFTCVIMVAEIERAFSADAPLERVLFEENFRGPLGNGWSWYHEIRDRWKIDAERGELAIQPVGGWMPTLNNVPLCVVPEDRKDGSLAVEVSIEHAARGDYEFAGLMWYFDDKNFVVIRKGPHGDDGKSVALLRLKDGQGQWVKAVPYEAAAVDVRMVVTGGKAAGWYRAANADAWQPIAEVELPGSGPAKIGLRTGNGEGDKLTRARFSRLRVLGVGGGEGGG